MCEEEYFIHDINDYNEYKKLKPVKTYKYKNVRFICSQCGNESIKTFRNLTPDFLCRICTNRNAQCSEAVKEKKRNTCIKHFGTPYSCSAPEIKDRIKQTNIEKYGVANVFQSDEIKEKIKATNTERYGTPYFFQSDKAKEQIKQTCLERYGVENYNQSEESKIKHMQTCMEHYGVPYFFQSDKAKEQIKQTCLERYGVENYSQTEEYKRQCKETNLNRYGHESYAQTNEFNERVKTTCLNRYGVAHYTRTLDYKKDVSLKFKDLIEKKLKPLNLDVLNRSKNNITLHCNNCNHNFTLANSTCNNLLRNYPESFCPTCSRIITVGISGKEKELLSYIKSIYLGDIQENTRMVIPPKELDIYLPDLNLAFEFDGTYWHADPRIYAPTDFVKHCESTAQEIWNKDKQKDLLCEQHNINLIRIKEYDWTFNIDYIKKFIWLKIYE